MRARMGEEDGRERERERERVSPWTARSYDPSMIYSSSQQPPGLAVFPADWIEIEF